MIFESISNKYFSAVNRFKRTVFDIGGRLKEFKSAQEWASASKIEENLKQLSDFANAETLHTVAKKKVSEVKNIGKAANLSLKEARKVFSKEGRAALASNLNISQATKHIKQLAEGNIAGRKFLEISKHKWFRSVAWGVGLSLGLSFAGKIINSFDPEPVLPKKDKHGYDVMTETLTDFGSPVKLLKTASKIITPYYSSVRKGVITTTGAITNKNMSLYLSKRAIGHTRY
jgi:hypothetical protein